MAERRMFAKTIVLSDAFLDMPLSARCLYFTLGVTAYDKGIITNARAMARATGANESDIDLLLRENYIKETPEGNYQITNWEENNGIGESANLRTGHAYREWRKAVLTRDGCRCAICGATENLEAHHIKPLATNPELATDVDNGITLCASCHKEAHRSKRESKFNSALISAILSESKENRTIRFSYDSFREKYGENIFGFTQPKRMLDATAIVLSESDIVIKTGIQVQTNGKKGNGFAIKKVVRNER